MTAHQDSLYPADWRRIARQDWHRVHVMLADGDAEGAGFFLQQALEKYLKAYLLERGWKLKKIHTLQSLLDEAAEFDAAVTSFRPLCERVSGFYIAERYPTLSGSRLETENVRQELSMVRALIRVLFPDEALE
ncbi:MAG: HEPN domain-containing protein [Candidatus Binatia bacterium]